MRHSIKTVIQVNEKRFSTAEPAARMLAEEVADDLARPRYLDSDPRCNWDVDAFWKCRDRIEKRAYGRFLKVCTHLLK